MTSRIHHTCMSDFAFLNATNLIRFHRDNGNCVAAEGDEFDIVASSTAVYQHDSANVSGF